MMHPQRYTSTHSSSTKTPQSWPVMASSSCSSPSATDSVPWETEQPRPDSISFPIEHSIDAQTRCEPQSPRSDHSSISQNYPNPAISRNPHTGCLEDAITEDVHCGAVVPTLSNTPTMMPQSMLPDDAVPHPQVKTYVTDERERSFDCDNMHTERFPTSSPQVSCVMPFNEPGLSDEDNNSLFRELRLDRRNLILDSVYDDVPHIIITPPEDTWDATAVYWENRLGFQSPDHLMVIEYPSPLITSVPPPVDGCSHRGWDDPQVVERSDGVSQPPSIFNHTKFMQSMERSTAEYQGLSHVVTALQKHQLKAAAFAASHIADSFRTRYDCPDFFCRLEKPFQWSDPAEPLILASRYYLGTTVIDSVCPFTAPHIIINESPPPNPWIAWGNATNDPQDCDNGRYLTVPSHLVSFVNADGLDDADSFAPWADSGEDSCSLPDSSSPSTPLTGEDHEADAFFVSCCRSDEPCDCSGEAIAMGGAELELATPTTWAADLARPTCDIFANGDDDDDDDGLPPFDEWYLTILERTRGAN